MVTAAAADSPVDARLQAFWRRVRHLHGRRVAAAFALRALLLAAGPTLVAIWWWPARWPAAVAAAALFVAGAALLSRFSMRQRLAVAWLQGVDAAPRGLADEFATWLEVGSRADAPMALWLAKDLDGRVATLTAPQLAAVGRQRLFGRRLLLIAGLLLLLAWLLAWLLDPNWSGLLSGKPPQPPPPPPPPLTNVGVAAAQVSGGAPQAPGDEPQRPPDPPPPLDLPDDQHFVVPRFVADGPSRKERVRAAELPQAGGQGAAPRTAGGSRGGVPEPTAEEFQRAAENAQRARHVAPREQPIVRRFFELLQQAGAGK